MASTRTRTHWTGAVALALCCAPACAAPAQQKPAGSALARYDLTADPAATWELPKKLREVSGLAAADDGRLFAHNDERAIIYELDARSGAVVKSFALAAPGTPGDASETLRGDFEGLAIAAGAFYLVTSDGTLYRAAREGGDGERVAFEKTATGAGAQCEVEGLAHEPAGNVLLLACKTPLVSAHVGRLTIFRWSLDRRALDPARPSLQLPLADVTRGTALRAFSASGIERDPATGNYILLAARQQAIAELTPAGRVLSITRLPASRHPQAEGLTILPDGRLLIADEGGKKGDGRVRVYGR